MYWPKAFRGLFDFSYQRRGLEVPIFYISYLIGSIMAGAVVGTIISAIMKSDSIRIAWNIDYITASILFLIVSHLFILKKGLGNEIKIIWILPIVAAGLTLFAGGHVIGLIIPTILSAMANKNNLNKNTSEKSQDKPKEENKSEAQTVQETASKQESDPFQQAA